MENILKKKRIIINDIVAVPGSGGVFSILTDFYNEVKEYSANNKDIEWIFLLNDNYFDETDCIKIIKLPEIKKSWFKRLKFEFFSGKNIINNMNPDIYVSLQNIMTLGVKSKKITYLHQPLPYSKIHFSFLKQSERKLWVYKNLVGKIINFSLWKTDTDIIVQTQWMKNELLKRKISKDNNIKIIGPKNISIDKSIINKTPKNNQFFYPATAMTYKNHKNLFEAVRILENKNYNFEIFCTISKEDANLLNLFVPKSVTLKGKLKREEILKAYGDNILVFPSLLETYGLPLIEARLSNDFIIAGNTEFAKEILENYKNVNYFDPYNSKSLADKMEEVLKISSLKLHNDKFEINDESLMRMLVNDSFVK